MNCRGEIKKTHMLVSEPIRGKSGSHLRLITFIVDIKYAVYSSGENEMSCICDTELKYKCVCQPGSLNKCIHFP